MRRGSHSFNCAQGAHGPHQIGRAGFAHLVFARRALKNWSSVGHWRARHGKSDLFFRLHCQKRQ